ncbi:MAG: O-antigen ligase family protein [Cyclobacteriaceae bacterium]|nr:O-antigen ligase family protein [Cyclobacteriaceae bacterium]
MFANKLTREGIRTSIFSLLVFSLPFSKGLTNVAIILAVLNWVQESSLIEKWVRLKSNRHFLLFISFFCLTVIGLSYSENFEQGLFILEKRIPLLVLPLIIFSSTAISKTEIRIIFKTLVLACLLASLICLGYAFYRNYKEGHTLSYIYNALVNGIHLPGRYDYLNYYYFTNYFFVEPLRIHPTYFALYILFSSCLVIWLLWDKNKLESGISIWIVLLLLYNVIIIVLLASRVQLFLLILVGTTFVMYYSYLKKKLLRGVIGFMSLISVITILIFLNPITRERFSTAINPRAHYSENVHGEGGLSLRIHEWRYTLEGIKSNFLFGTGTGDAQDVLQEVYLRNKFKIGYENSLNPHNQYLHTTLELGILGFIVLISNLINPFVLGFRKRQWLVIIFVLIIAVSFVPESVLELNRGIVFYAFFNSLLIRYFMNDRVFGTENA